MGRRGTTQRRGRRQGTGWAAVEPLEPRCLLAATINEFAIPTSASQPDGISTGPDGALWFGESSNHQIGRIDPTTKRIDEFPVPGQSDEIAAGSDGAVWFTEFPGNRVGRIDPVTHAATDFPTPGNSGNIEGIVAGPDGALWFTDFNGDKVDRIDPTTHAVDEIAIPGAPDPNNPSGISGITVGPDGAIWFTDAGPPRVGRIDTATRSVTVFPIPTAKAGASSIVAGPDGGLWFTEASASKIGRIDPATFAIDEFPIPTTNGQPTGIDVGSDGGLWFAEGFANQIGRIDPVTHALLEIAVPTPSSSPIGVAAGRDGNIWFTEGNGNKIGQVVIAAAATSTTMTRLTSDSPTSTPGQTVTFTATVVGLPGAGTPTGSITFRDGTAVLQVVPLDNTGHARFSTAALDLGSHAIEADYSGAVGFAPSAGKTPESVFLITNTTVMSSAGTSTVDQPVTFTATVTVTSGAGTPTGTVTFRDGTSVLQAVPVDNTGHATFNTAALAVGTHTITADFTGNGDFGPSSGSTTQIVQPAGSIQTSLILLAAPKPAAVGQRVGLVAIVSTSPRNVGTPTGTVTFREGTNVLQVVPLPSTGRAAFSISTLPAGQHSLSADYSGDAKFLPSSGSTTETIQAAGQNSSFVTLAAEPTTSTAGQNVTIAAIVAGPPDTGIPTGTVTFREGTSILMVVPLTSGQAVFMTTALAVGGHTIAADYSGDSNFTPSSNTTLVTVQSGTQQTATTTTVVAAPPASTAGQTVTFTANVTGPGGMVPTGSVTFHEGRTILKVVPLDNAGRAAFLTATLAPGSHTIAADYGGDTRFAPSGGSALATVNPIVNGGDGPQVTSLLRFGFHAFPTTLVLGFSTPLNPAQAGNPANYRLFGPLQARGGRFIAIDSAVYDPATNTVTLHPRSLLDLHRQYLLQVNGTTAGGLTDTAGRLLDGVGSGRPGSDFVRVFGSEVFVGPFGTLGLGTHVLTGRQVVSPVAVNALRARGTHFRSIRTARH